MTTPPEQRIRTLLTTLYGEEVGERCWLRLRRRLESWRAQIAAQPARRPAKLSEQDAILITYGDQFNDPPEPPLRTLKRFLDRHLAGCISGVHILPCFPYSSDDGFAVIDFMRVDPGLGDWDDIAALGQDYRIMLDAVINHVSAQSAWFQAFRRGEKPYADYFIRVAPDTDLSQVVRPRALPLLTPVETENGVQQVWTTFSADQVDLNYANPDVLLDITDVLLEYVRRGAEIIRLDAIAYLWKEVGTPCIHLPQTHLVIKLWRAVLDAVAPDVLLITETNVPHAENVSYFGQPLPGSDRTDEAQLVYNFTLAPLTLHALHTGDVRRLQEWVATLSTPVAGAMYFNFIASHDGIGVRPAEGILSPEEVQALVDRTLAHGGQVSYKGDADGSRSVYELNTTLYDFLNDPARPQPQVDVRRFLASQVILLSLAGIPGIYVHSLFGSRNCHHCYAETGRVRSLNREKFELSDLEARLRSPRHHEGRVFAGYRRLLRVRRTRPAFRPDGQQRVLHLHRAVFSLLRSAPVGEGSVETDVLLCLVNVSPNAVQVRLPAELGYGHRWRDLLSGDHLVESVVPLRGYQSRWLVPDDENNEAGPAGPA
ncbi:MAG: sugar phosphorylase [Caldilineae bacterium]|nr:MAG: sugar phosphorylase [Caldilineae bacterium]